MNQSAAHGRTKRRTIRIGMGAGLIAIAGLGLSACGGTSAIDSAKVDSIITSKINELAPNATVSADCPSGIKIQSGATFDCPVTVNGKQFTYTVTQTDDQGNVSAVPSNMALVSLTAAQDQISKGLAGQVAGTSDWQTTCNPEGAVDTLLITQAGSTFTCTADGTGQDGNPASVSIDVTVKDNAGNLTWKAQQQ
ncbi:MAG: DUF4333 domain-containing protein [Candidatus Nanopelagicales bacterium]